MFKVPELYRITTWSMPNNSLCSSSIDGNNGAFIIHDFTTKNQKIILFCIASDGCGWEHVSVSLKYLNLESIKKCPSWEQMCFIKDLFWDLEDTVVQFHPPKSEYVNLHNYCLHLWRKKDTNIETPPKFLVG